MSIQYLRWDLNSQHSDCESPPLTTRPWAPILFLSDQCSTNFPLRSVERSQATVFNQRDFIVVTTLNIKLLYAIGSGPYRPSPRTDNAGFCTRYYVRCGYRYILTYLPTYLPIYLSTYLPT